MARPRKQSDPNRWPVPCGRCDEHHQIVANWPDGGVCRYCYQQAKRTRGTCDCGHEGVLPGRIDGHAACRSCSGLKLNIDCKTCGAEDELYRGSRCWPCELAVLVDQSLTNPDTGVMAAELVPVAITLKSMKRSHSGVTRIRQRHVTAFLKDAAVAPTITREKLDELPGADRTRNYIRGWSNPVPCRAVVDAWLIGDQDRASQAAAYRQAGVATTGGRAWRGLVGGDGVPVRDPPPGRARPGHG